ncbi:hypothetical protein TNCV_2756531 [Trichonephila clavipes]|nr:hypothetical protein TNCV_2756531 [Trichonephila clavipes]
MGAAVMELTMTGSLLRRSGDSSRNSLRIAQVRGRTVWRRYMVTRQKDPKEGVAELELPVVQSCLENNCKICRVGYVHCHIPLPLLLRVEQSTLMSHPTSSARQKDDRGNDADELGWKELPFWPQRNPKGDLVEIAISPSQLIEKKIPQEKFLAAFIHFPEELNFFSLMLKHLRFDIFELQETKLPVRLISTRNERRPVQGQETTTLRVKGDIVDVLRELDNGG